ncbi:MAG: hypothetical protein A2Y55_07450 [Actinobacteria bacterium RBG_16_68_12]|nr:MAG: hypothetical protein A2Y55_07450 [Actinobacteria bacterium RBG_16_68_12]
MVQRFSLMSLRRLRRTICLKGVICMKLGHVGLVVGMAANGSHWSPHRGDLLVVRLLSNPSTGYAGECAPARVPCSPSWAARTSHRRTGSVSAHGGWPFFASESRQYTARTLDSRVHEVVG